MVGNPKIFLDTSVFGAYFDEHQPERMSLTRSFWKKSKSFESFISEVTVTELRATASKAKREKLLKLAYGFGVLPVTKEADMLAKEYIKEKIVPKRYFNDALQIAVATVNGIPTVLSWNFRHMVNQKVKTKVNAINVSLNYQVVQILAPAELV